MCALMPYEVAAKRTWREWLRHRDLMTLKELRRAWKHELANGRRREIATGIAHAIARKEHAELLAIARGLSPKPTR